MKREQAARFDALEVRKLLSTAQVAAIRPSVPLTFGGMLNVNVNDSSQTENADGSWTTTVPVSGSLGAVGKVKGVWETSIDQNGYVDGPDELLLQSKTPKGSFVISFNNINKGKPAKVTPSLGFYQHGQHLASGTGAFARATEAGSIELMDDLKKGDVTSLVLITVPPAAQVAG